MKTKEDHIWDSLLAHAAPAFAGDDAGIPFGLSTRVLARLRDEQRQAALWERTGRRAVFASLAAVLGLALFTFVMAEHTSDDVDPAVQSMAAVENVPVS